MLNDYYQLELKIEKPIGYDRKRSFHFIKLQQQR